MMFGFDGGLARGRADGFRLGDATVRGVVADGLGAGAARLVLGACEHAESRATKAAKAANVRRGWYESRRDRLIARRGAGVR